MVVGDPLRIVEFAKQDLDGDRSNSQFRIIHSSVNEAQRASPFLMNPAPPTTASAHGYD